MKTVPSDVLERALSIMPNEQVTFHKGPHDWKMEHEIEGPARLFAPISDGFVREVFRELPEDWQGSISFFFVGQHWHVKKRTCPPLNTEEKIEL